MVSAQMPVSAVTGTELFRNSCLINPSHPSSYLLQATACKGRESLLGSVLLAPRSVRFRAEHSGRAPLTRCHHEASVGCACHRRLGLLLCLGLLYILSFYPGT